MSRPLIADALFTHITCPLRRPGCEGCGLSWRANLGAGLGPLKVSVDLGAAALAAHLSDAVLPVGRAPAGLHALTAVVDLLVVVRLVLHHFPQPAHRLGPFPCRRAAAAQRVGAGDGHAAHVGDDLTDVVTMADEAAANDLLRTQTNARLQTIEIGGPLIQSDVSITNVINEIQDDHHS